jgi:hypothetical protein
MEVITYIWVSSNLLDDLLVKMSRVAQKASGDVVCVLKSTERCYGELRALREIPLGSLDLSMFVLNPLVMCTSCSVCDVFVENNDIRVGDLFGLCRGEEGSCFVVNGVHGEWEGRGQQRQKR